MCVCVGGKEGRRFNKSNKLRSIILKLNQNKTIGGGQTHGDTGSLFVFFFFNQSSSIKVSLVRLDTEDATYDIQTDIFIKNIYLKWHEKYSPGSWVVTCQTNAISLETESKNKIETNFFLVTTAITKLPRRRRLMTIWSGPTKTAFNGETGCSCCTDEDTLPCYVFDGDGICLLELL